MGAASGKWISGVAVMSVSGSSGVTSVTARVRSALLAALARHVLRERRGPDVLGDRDRLLVGVCTVETGRRLRGVFRRERGLTGRRRRVHGYAALRVPERVEALVVGVCVPAYDGSGRRRRSAGSRRRLGQSPSGRTACRGRNRQRQSQPGRGQGGRAGSKGDTPTGTARASGSELHCSVLSVKVVGGGAADASVVRWHPRAQW